MYNKIPQVIEQRTYLNLKTPKLKEKTIIFTHSPEDATTLHSSIAAFEQEFKTRLAEESDGKTKSVTSFTEEGNRITGFIELTGIRPWIRRLLGYISKKQSGYGGE